MATSARRLRIPHPDLSETQKTYLNADYTTGSNLSVDSNVGFAATQIAVVGNPREEQTEADNITGISGNQTITLSGTLKFDHNSNTPIYRSEYDQVEISYYDGSTWAVLTTIDIQWDQLNTIYVHSGGTDAYSYRFRFYNSASGDFSEYSGSQAGSGYSKNQIGSMVQRVRKIVADPNKQIVSDSEILSLFTAAKDIIRAKSPEGGWYFWKNTSSAITTTASTFKYNLDSISDYIDFIGQIRYRYDNSDGVDTTYPLDQLTDLEFYELTQDNDREDDDWAEAYRILVGDGSSDSGYIEVYPTPATTGRGTFYVDYYELEQDYDSFSDTTKIPIPQLLVYFAVAEIEQIKGNDGKSKVYRDLFFGPPPDKRDNENLTGLALLYSIHNKKLRALKKPRVLKKFKGRGYLSRVYRGRSHSRSQSDRINYW
jgi:hypothetical protein